MGWKYYRTAGVACAVVAALFLAAGCAKRVSRTESWRTELVAGPHVVEHQVAPGESLALIADNYYGDPARAEDIARANGVSDPDRLATGSVLILDFSADEWQSTRQRAAAMRSYNRGVEFQQQEQLVEAERQFRQAIETAPEFVNARYNLALVLLKRGQHDQAHDILAELTQQRPDDPDFRFALGNVRFLQARFAEAATDFQRLLAAHPDHRRGAFSLARSLQEAGRTTEAIAAWEAFLRLDDTSSWAVQARRHLQELRRE